MGLKTAIVLADGRGMRLRPYTEDLPKPMIDVEGYPIIYWIARWLERNNIKKMVIGVAHQKEKIYKWLESPGLNLNMDIVISEHFIKSGTGGGIKHAIKNANIKDKCVLAMNGDELTDLSLINVLSQLLGMTL